MTDGIKNKAEYVSREIYSLSNLGEPRTKKAWSSFRGQSFEKEEILLNCGGAGRALVPGSQEIRAVIP